MASKSKDILLSRPVHQLLGTALSALESKTDIIAETYGETVEIGNAHHENGPEEFWREELSRALSKLEALRETHRYATVYDPSNDDRQVGLGSGVTVIEQFPKNDRIEARYTVVAANDILVCTRLWVAHPPSWLNMETTRGIALLNRRVGDKSIEVAIPNGSLRMDIREVGTGDFQLSLPSKLSKDKPKT